MKQQLYLLPNLDAAKALTETVKSAGVLHRHVHIAYKDHLAIQKQGLNDLNFIQEFDAVHAGIRGFLAGCLLAVATGFILCELLEEHPVATTIIFFSCLVVLGFTTWLGGLIGLSSDNFRLQPFHDHLQKGASIVIINIDKKTDHTIRELILNSCPLAKPVGTSNSIDNPFSGNLYLRKHS